MLGRNEKAIAKIINSIKSLMEENEFEVCILPEENEFFKMSRNYWISLIGGKLYYYNVDAFKTYEIDGNNFSDVKYYISILVGVNAYIQKQLKLRKDLVQYYTTFKRKFHQEPNAVIVNIRWHCDSEICHDTKKITLNDRHDGNEISHCEKLSDLIALTKCKAKISQYFTIEGFEEYLFEGEKRTIE